MLEAVRESEGPKTKTVPVEPHMKNVSVEPHMKNVPVEPHMKNAPVEPRMKKVPVEPHERKRGADTQAYPSGCSMEGGGLSVQGTCPPMLRHHTTKPRVVGSHPLEKTHFRCSELGLVPFNGGNVIYTTVSCHR